MQKEATPNDVQTQYNKLNLKLQNVVDSLFDSVRILIKENAELKKKLYESTPKENDEKPV